MLIYEGTGVTTVRKSINKPFAGLYFGSQLALESLTALTIRIFIERSGGDVEICPEMPFIDFVMLRMKGTSYPYALRGSVYATTAKVYLTPDESNVGLNDKDEIVVEFKGMDSTKAYFFYAVEEPTAMGWNIVNYQKNQLKNGESSNKFPVAQWNAMTINKTDLISEVTLTLDNGFVMKKDIRELALEQVELDSVAYVKADGTQVVQLDKFLTIPLVGVTNIEITKTDEAAVIPFWLERYKSQFVTR
ncbi:hypothetical protein [Flavobacterium sp. 3HN19-14]|uniref:hypothetical protein n=1 Tax=Flavobacterium sp. 3HN19-14 TaxID=3448133 RepID=UPI003EE1286A